MNTSKNKKLVIFGNSDFAHLVYYYFDTDSDYNVEAFCVDDEYLNAKSFDNLPLIPYSRLKKEYPPETTYLFVAIGYKKLNSIRENIFNKLKSMGYKFANYIHGSNISPPHKDFSIGENCLILENNVIQPFSKIEDDVIIWSNSFIAHEAIIKKHSFIASNVSIGGYTEVGESCFIGMSTTLRDKIKIGKKCLIGAGLTILKDTDDFSVYINSKCQPLKMNSNEYFAKGHDI